MQPKDLAAVENMGQEMLKQEISKGLKEIAEREEVFVIIIDAINQVSDCCFSVRFTSFKLVFKRDCRVSVEIGEFVLIENLAPPFCSSSIPVSLGSIRFLSESAEGF